MNLSTFNSKQLIATYLACIVGVFALLSSATEWLLRTQVIPQDTLVRHVKLFSVTNSTYAAFGDSHIARGYNAPAPAVNLGYPSENIERMVWKMDRYLLRNPEPKKVIIQADPHLFAAYRIKAGLADYPQQFSDAPKMQLASYSKRYRPQLIALWRSYFKNGFRIISQIDQTAQGALLSPGVFSNWPEATQVNFTRDRVKLHTPINQFENAQSAVAYKAAVTKFISRGAKVCLVALPVSERYRLERRSLPKELALRWRDADAFFVQLTELEGVKFVDHRDFVNDPSHFRDSDHLNKKGAIAYSPHLDEACFGQEENEPLIDVAQRSN